MTNDVFSLAGKTVGVAGHRGMVGSAIVRRLARENCEILTVGRGEVDLREQGQVRAWVSAHKPDVVFLAAAKVGGIHICFLKKACYSRLFLCIWFAGIGSGLPTTQEKRLAKWQAFFVFYANNNRLQNP